LKRRAQLSITASPLLLALLAGCAMFVTHENAAPDWPTLEVRHHKVSGFEVIWRCYNYQSWAMRLSGGIPMACAEINFAARTCDIYAAHDADAGIIEHEETHCRGGQHPGDRTLTNAWTAYKEAAR
jgi:hypothetical protein